MNSDTVAAVSTATGTAAIAIVRMSGPDAVKIAKAVFYPGNDFKSHRIYYGKIIDPASREPIDEVMIAAMLSPKSYTGEDMVEIYCHGGIFVTSKVLELLMKNGASAAEPGEFTKRAYLNGKIDLLRAEAVNEIINARTEAALKIAQRQLRGSMSDRFALLRKKLLLMSAQIEVAIDHPDDGYFSDYDKLCREAAAIKKELQKFYESYDIGLKLREGFNIAIVGRPNVGKSTLFNQLLGDGRAIVTAIPGTTRDAIDAQISLTGKTAKLTDTAGIRDNAGEIEKIGIAKSWNETEKADLILWVIDKSSMFDENDEIIMKRLAGSDKKVIAVLNKQDKPSVFDKSILMQSMKTIEISAKYCEKIENLKKMISAEIDIRKDIDDYNIITTIRQKQKISEALSLISELSLHIKERYGDEIIGADLLSIVSVLDEFIGKISNDEVLETVFSNFCVGK